MRGFPGGSVAKNLPANAWGVSSIPVPGGSHMQLSLCTTPVEPVLYILGAATTEAHVPLSPCSAATEKWNEKQLENSPLWPQIREKPVQPWRTNAAKINKFIKKLLEEAIPKSGWLSSLQLMMKKLYTVGKNKTRRLLWLTSWAPCCKDEA